MTSSTVSEDQFFSDEVATFGDRLEAARTAKGLSSESLAAKLGVKTKTVLNWESDAASPRANKLSMLAGLLNVSIIWLLSGKGNGTTDVETNFERPEGVNDALGEIRALKRTLVQAIKRIEKLETRLQNTRPH